MEENSIKVDISVPFKTNRLAEIAYDVLRVDEEPKRSRVSKKLSVEKNNLKVTFVGETAKQVRVGVTCFFDNINLILRTMNFAGDPISETYSHY